MSPKTLLAILPILRIRVAFVSITSKSVEPDSMVDRMKRATLSSSEQVFRRIVYDPKCAQCRKRGATTCTHRPELKWSDSRATANLKAVMSALSERAFQREIANEEADSEIGSVFSSEQLKFLEDSEYVMPSGTNVKYVYVGIDPSGGGRMSRYAIVSVVIVDDVNGGRRDYVVVGADFVEGDNYSTIRQVLVNHIYTLQHTPGLENALPIVIPENNLSFHHHHISEDLQQLRSAHYRSDYHIFDVGDGGRAGVHQDNDKKHGIVVSIGRKLESRHLFIWRDLVSVGEYDTGLTAVNANQYMARSILVDDLRSFKCIAKKSNTIDGRPKYIYSGKSSGSKDDAVIALGIPLLFWQAANRQVVAERV